MSRYFFEKKPKPCLAGNSNYQFKSGRGHFLGYLEVDRTPLLLNKLGPLKQKGLDYSEPDERSYGGREKKI